MTTQPDGFKTFTAEIVVEIVQKFKKQYEQCQGDAAALTTLKAQINSALQSASIDNAKLPDTQRKESSLGSMAEKLTFCLHGVGLEMIKVKAGSFMMGSLVDEIGRANDERLHRVTITKDYYLGKYPVTQAQWVAIMGKNPSRFKGDNRPVENVNWYDAKDFCQKLNKRYTSILPAEYRFNLPTEAQWEYACRAGRQTALNNGKNLTSCFDECHNLDEVAWYAANSGASTHTVGGKAPNRWGLYDMHGNVWEWCRDWYGPYPDYVIDPMGPSLGAYRVCRGGAWDFRANLCRAARRRSGSPDNCYCGRGFRLAIVPEN